MLERNIAQIGKDMEAAEAKVAKADQSNSKNKSAKVSEAQEDMRRARSRWDSEAPNSFERLQQVDEARIAFLRDALVRYETSLVDLHTSQVKSSERAIAELLEINPTDEPMDFVTKRFAQQSMTTAPRPTASMNRTASISDAGSIKSSGGAGSSLKSKFGTLLRGKRSGSPKKRQSMMQNSPLSASVGRQALPETREEPEERQSAATSTTAPTYGNGTRGQANQVPQSTAEISSDSGNFPQRALQPAEQPQSEVDIFQTRAPTASTSETLTRDAFASQRIPEAEEPVTNLQNSLRGVNIRHDSIIASRDEDDAAMDKVSSTLRAQSTISRRSRGRRDNRNTISGTPGGEESAQDIARDVLGSPVPRATEPIYESAAPLSPSGTSSFLARGNGIDRQNTSSAFSFDGNESIRSTRSNASALRPVVHAEPTADGLHLSVIETINLHLAADGALTNLQVAGEAAMAYINPPDDMSFKLHVQCPEAIESLDANQHLLTAQGQNTYEVRPLSIPHVINLFKYKITPNASRGSRFLPILINQKWSPEEKQTSVKLTYRLNPSFGAGSLTLHNVEVIVSISGSANSCVAKPSGTFVKRSSKLVWRLNELTLESGSEGSLLARFKTDSLCPPGSTVELKFKTASSTIARGSGFGVYATRSRDNPFADTPTVENVLVSNAYVMQSGSYTIATVV